MGKIFDLDLPAWGPYNKNIFGTAHVTDKEKGLRFDVNLFPGCYRRSVLIPKDIVDSGIKMWKSSKDLSHYVYRYELQWKDEIYMESDFCSDNEKMIITNTFYNNTDNNESLTLDAVFSLSGSSGYRKDLVGKLVKTEVDTKWIEATDYDRIITKQVMAPDGFRKGEDRENAFVGGSFLHSRYIKAGDVIEYNNVNFAGNTFTVRYRGEGSITVKLNDKEYKLDLPKTEEVTNFKFDTTGEQVSDITVYYNSDGVDIDGFLIGDNATFYDEPELFIPEFEGDSNEFTVKFGKYEYKVKCECETSAIREIHADNLDVVLADYINNHIASKIGTGKKRYVDLFIRPVYMEPHSTKTVTITIWPNQKDSYDYDHELFIPEHNAEGDAYHLSQRIMQAVTLTNVVWPIYCKKGFIKHNTPGRYWDCMYTWDSGFIGMGLLQASEKRAKECLYTYLTEVGDKDSPYIQHGTPLPTQIFLYSAIFEKTEDLDFVKEVYPMVRQQYRFFADSRKNGRAHDTGMFSLWDIFYNSGGWDDNPTQVYVHKNKLEADVCPVINTAFTVLCAKILKNIAGHIGEDTVEYDEDIAFYSNAINTYAWDEDSGYYGYVDHRGTPHIMKVDGINADMGMDGIYPYVAGITDDKKDARILDHIKNGLITDAGLSIIDVNAPYFRNDGYWNGSVWMPHQWILWKAFLDNGEEELCIDLAMNTLKMWEKEVATTYNCYEHFMIANCRGAGYHQFSGLSTPVLMWFNTFFKPYTITCGHFGCYINVAKEENKFSFDVSLNGKKPMIIVCLEEGKEYKFATTGKVKAVNKGAYLISFEKETNEHIEISC